MPTGLEERRYFTSPLSRLSTLAQVANMRASDSLFSCKEEATYEPIQSWLLTEDIKNLQSRIKESTRSRAAG